MTAVPLAAATLIGTAEIGRIEHGRITRVYPAATAWVARVKGLLHGLIALQATGARLVRGTDAAAARHDATRLAGMLEESTRLATGLPDAITAAAGRVLAAAGIEVLGRDALGKRFLSIENGFTLDAAARQAAGCVADRDLGTDVFGDPLRMWRDLLGDTSRRRAAGGFFPFMGVD